jgi:hypothetical protein
VRKGCSELNVGFVGDDDSHFYLVFHLFCSSHHSWILFIYLFVIVAEWSVVIAAFVLSMGYDLAGQTQNMKFGFARLEVLTVVLLKIQFFWDVMLCRLVNSCHFIGIYCCHVRDANLNMRGCSFYKSL